MADQSAAPNSENKTEPQVIANKKERHRTPQNAAAVFIVKGAAAHVLGTTLTVGAQYDSRTKARLVVEYTQPEKPNDEILKQIEQAAAAKVKENLEIIVTTQTRAKAEAWYSAHPVNKQFIYERRPPPAHLNQLNILEIPGWTVGCVPTTDFVKRTGDVGQITIVKANHRPQKKELEIVFEISDRTGSAAKADTTTESAVTISPYNNTRHVANELVTQFIDCLNKTAGIKLTDEQVQQLKGTLVPKTEATLNLVKNQAYASGFKAHLK